MSIPSTLVPFYDQVRVHGSIGDFFVEDWAKLYYETYHFLKTER